MKQCPHCQAELQEGARFCLYCMTPLVEKEYLSPRRKRLGAALLAWIFGAIAVAAVVAVGILMLSGGDDPGQGDSMQAPPHLQTSGTTPGKPFPEQPVGSTQAQPGGSESQPETEADRPWYDTPWFPFLPENPGGNDDAPGTTGDAPDTTPQPTPGSNTPTTAPTTTPTSRPTTPPTSTPTTAPTTAHTEPVEIDYGNGIPGSVGYRTRLSILFPVNLEEEDIWFEEIGVNPESSYYRTGNMPENEWYTEYPASYSRNGIIEVPAYMPSGGKVVGVGPGAGYWVSMTLPETIRLIQSSAFYDDGTAYSELAHLYMRSDLFDIEDGAFPPLSMRMYTVTLHTSADCKNSAGEYYKDIAGRYGCVWEEWNG